MNLLFCHDGPIEIDTNGNGYPGNMNKKALERYYKIADKLFYVTRTNLITPEEATHEQINMDNLEYVSCPNLSSLKGQLTQRQKAREIVDKVMKKSDLVVVRLPSVLGEIVIESAKSFNKKYVIELVGCTWDAYWNYGIKGKLIAPYAFYKTKKLVSEAEYVIYVTSEFLQNRYPTTGKSINASNVMLEDFEESILEQRLEKIKNKPKAEKIIIGTTAAVDVIYKGQQYIIEAISELKEKGFSNIEYQVVGNGDQTFLQNLAIKLGVKDQVKFMGTLTHKEVYTWLTRIDIYSQPSRQEGLPRALIEAMSKGVPAFGARTAGIPELLEEKYIFSNTNKNIGEIIKIIESYDTESMLKQSVINFEEAKKYDENLINERRDKFFLDYKKNAIAKK